MRADVAKTPEPVQRLRGLFDAASQRELDHSTTASLASAGHTTRPSVRMATIAGVDARGPVFFPDWRSGKGQQLSDDPRAALCFDWQVLHQRIALECVTVHLADAEAERYRDRQTHANHLAAWVADTPPADGEGDTIDARVRAVRCRFRDGPMPRPPEWRALRLEPDLNQLWKTGSRHLHARERFTRDTKGLWDRETSAPHCDRRSSARVSARTSGPDRSRAGR